MTRRYEFTESPLHIDRTPGAWQADDYGYGSDFREWPEIVLNVVVWLVGIPALCGGFWFGIAYLLGWLS